METRNGKVKQVNKEKIGEREREGKIRKKKRDNYDQKKLQDSYI